jgi:3-hydroxyisobutyrate dehydrogenase
LSISTPPDLRRRFFVVRAADRVTAFCNPGLDIDEIRCMTERMSATRIAFLGLGIMGTGMTRRLLGAGFSVAVYNRNPAKSAAVVADGAREAASPRAAAAGADIIFSMVADDVASRSMWLGEEGALAGAGKNAVIVECSTLTVAWVTELAQTVAATGREFLDAPVTGSKNAAAAGELNFLVGGSDAGLEKIRPAFRAMGRTVTHLGPAGSGAFVKLVNNFVAGVHVAAIAEAYAMIQRSNLDPAKALAILADGSVGSPVTKMVAGRMAAADFAPHFPLKLMAKDLGYAIGEASARGQTLATATTARECFRAAIALGHGDKDMAAVVLPMREISATQ